MTTKVSLVLFCLLSPLFLASQVSSNMNLLHQEEYAGTGCNDIWGYADDAGNEYALVGLQHGISILNVTDPSNVFEEFNLSRPFSNWRDLKEHNGYVYAVDDQEGAGMIIIDFTNPSAGITHTFWTTDAGTGTDFDQCHNLFVDENGIAYLFGCNNISPQSKRGAIMIDLEADPLDPPVLGFYQTHYIHDGYVKDDVLWASQIYEGNLAAIDVSNKANPVIIGTVGTPNAFCHNVWLNDSGTHAFTTDEKSNAYIGSFDVTDPTSMFEVDRVQSFDNSGSIPHNTFWKDNFLITSYYKDGVVIHDATYPDNIVKVGFYDTAPNDSGNGFDGCWGVYPYLPSGNILVSDQEADFFLLEPDFEQASYLQGNVTNVFSGASLNNVEVTILGSDVTTDTNLLGDYQTGISPAGTYDIEFSRNGYVTQVVQGQVLESGLLSIIDVQLQPTSSSGQGLSLNLSLEGFSDDMGGMRTDLSDQDILLHSQPYGVAPYSYTGLEFAQNFPAGTVDWILLELRLPSDPFVVAERRAFLLRNDGAVMSTSGDTNLNFTNTGEYYLVVNHRNHLGVLSSSKVHVDAGVTYSFNSSVDQAAGNEQQSMVNGQAALHAGDMDGNGIMNILDFTIWFADNTAVGTYEPQDLDGNGIVNILDFLLWFDNSSLIGVPEVAY